LASDRRLQIAAALHLFAIAAAVLGPTSPPLPLFLTITGLALVVLALNRAPTTPEAAEIPAPAAAATDDGHPPREYFATDAISPSRLEAGMRGPLWAELTARMSHELRTPLNAVIGFSDMMSAELFGPLGHDRYRDYARHIRECSRALLKCTEDTLALTATLAQTNETKITRTVRLNELISEAAELHASTAGTSSLKLAMPDCREYEVLGETRPMRQIVINLLAEAHQRACRGATISILLAAECDTISLSIRVEKALPRADEGQAPLSICIARVLLEQQGLALVETDDHDSWTATTSFHRPVQEDFFSAAAM
jgi:signal transduction histidine kinase